MKLTIILFLILSPVLAFSQIELPTIESEEDWEKVKAAIIYVTSDVFSQSPLNNVTLIGTPYKKDDND